MELYRLTPNNRKRYNWPAIFEDQKESGFSIRRYCAAFKAGDVQLDDLAERPLF